MGNDRNYRNFQEFVEQNRSIVTDKSAARALSSFLKPGKNSLELAIGYTKKYMYKTDPVKRQQVIDGMIENGMLDGSFELTYDGAERIYNKTRTKLSEDEKKVIDLFDSVRDADLIANFLFCVNPEIREKVRNSENLYKVILKVGSKKKRKTRIEQNSDQRIVTIPAKQEDDFISPDLEYAITIVPRVEFTGEQEYQRKLRVLLRKKVERDVFPVFKKDQDAAFKLIDKKIQSSTNENVRDVYTEARNIYKEYTKVKAINVNPEFRDPETGERGVLPTLHQNIGIYHLVKEGRFGIFDGCGTGKTAIATLAQPLIEREMQYKLQTRIKEGGRDFVRTIVVCPNPAKKAWKKGLIGKVEERYLDNINESDVAIINGGPKSAEFVESLKNKRWIVVNYDQLITNVNGGEKLLVDTLIDLGVDYLISDESHQIKSHRLVTSGGESEKTRPTLSAAFRKLADKSEYLCLLTGSPMPDNMNDYGVLYHLLHPDKLKDPSQFSKLYEKSPRLLYTLFNERTIRRTAEDINEGLECVLHDELIDLDPLQKDLYQHLLEWQSKSWLTQARKAVLDPRLVDPAILKSAGLLGRVKVENSAKYKRLEELLTSPDGPVEKGENFVIFSSMYQEGVTREGNESLRKRYLEEGVQEEFELTDGLMRKIVVDVITNGINSIEKLRSKLSPNKKDKSEFEKEFEESIVRLKKNKKISINGDEIVINTTANGAVNKYITYFNELEFDVPLAKRLESKLQQKYGKKYNIGVIDGKIEDIEERERLVDEVGKSLTGILCTTDTGGESLDFTHASYAYFLDTDYKPKTEEQAIARLLRKGQKKKVNIIKLLGKDVCDEPLEDYVEKKKVIIKTAIDGYSITDEEKQFLDDVEGKQFGEMLRRGLGGVPINTLEAKIDSINSFEIVKRTRRMGHKSTYSSINYETTEAQELMRLIGQDPVNCWQKPEIVEKYVRLLSNLSVPIVHRARISDLIRRANNKEIIFPKKVISEGAGPSILYNAYQELKQIIKANGLSVPFVLDRDISKAMLAQGNNPNKILGDMTGKRSKLGDGEFSMVDNASISLLQNSSEVKRTLLEAHRILKPGIGLLELTVEGRKFYDGSAESEEKVGDKLVKRDFYEGLGKLGFEVISQKNQGFAISRLFFNKLKEEKGAHFAQAYENKLNGTYFILAKKVANPTDVDAANFWWIRPQSLVEEDGEEDSQESSETEQEDDESIRDPSQSRSIIIPSSRRKGRVRRFEPKRESSKRINHPDLEITTDQSGVVQSVKKLGGN